MYVSKIVLSAVQPRALLCTRRLAENDCVCLHVFLSTKAVHNCARVLLVCNQNTFEVNLVRMYITTHSDAVYCICNK